MKRTNVLLCAAVGVFVAAEITLGTLLQVQHGHTVTVCSYASVILACLFCLLSASRSVAYFSTQLGLFCTVGADFFLVWLPERQQLPAMLFFSVAQLAYFARLYAADTSPRRRRLHLILRLALSALILPVTALVLRGGTDAVALVSMFYYVNLIVNIVFAFWQAERPPLFAVGLLLFLCCDTLIGLSCLDAYFPISADSLIWRITHPGFDLAWAFYVPSQTLIALSLLPHRLRKAKHS
ncbi:MAG: hypothetical protein IJW51_06320 [Clostridia bacterium]|nr:hypothetical protein [Clostridia bacterium]